MLLTARCTAVLMFPIPNHHLVCLHIQTPSQGQYSGSQGPLYPQMPFKWSTKGIGQV